MTVVTFLFQAKDDENYENILPAGLERIGVFAPHLDCVNLSVNLALVKIEGKLQCYIQSHDGFKTVPFKTVENLDLATLRMKSKIAVQLSSKEQETDDFFGKLLDKINSDASSFLMDKSRVVLSCSGDKSIFYGAPQDLNVEELTTYIEDEEEEGNIKSKKRSLDKNAPLQFKLFWSTVLEETTTGVPQYAPIIYHQRSKNSF